MSQSRAPVAEHVPSKDTPLRRRASHAAANVMILAALVAVALWSGFLIWLALDILEGWFG